MLVHLLEAGGTSAGVRLIAGETQVAAASIVGATPVSATYTSNGESQLFYFMSLVPLNKKECLKCLSVATKETLVEICLFQEMLCFF